MTNPRFINITTNGSVFSFLWLSNIPLYVCESEVAQSCPTLCDPTDCSPPSSFTYGILQARILEWVAISFFRGSSQPRDRTQVSRIAGRRFNLWVTREAHMYVIHLYPFIYWWPFRLLPCPGYANSAAMNIGAHVSFWIMVRVRVRLIWFFASNWFRHLIGTWCYLTVVLTCILLLANHVKHLSMCWFATIYFLVGEGNGTPLQYSCLENPMDGGAW